MIKVGVTGQNGFIGTHLVNHLGLQPDQFEQVPFKRSYFKDPDKLQQFVSVCDAVVHLAALNRHNNPEVIYETNIRLVEKIIEAMEKENATPYVLFSSSIQEENNNHYGRSKKEGRKLFERWAIRNDTSFSGLVIPNVFGPFGEPYYNSVVSTFCHQLIHDETPEIIEDNSINLIYVNELVDYIIRQIKDEVTSQKSVIEKKVLAHSKAIKVSKLLEELKTYKRQYLQKGILPDLDNPFHRNLFSTFQAYIDFEDFFPVKVDLHSDKRGSFAELVKANSGGQTSLSTTVPGITRGNHFHTRKVERFAVIKGKAKIELRRIGQDKKYTFTLDGNPPLFVDMPIWHTHNITNIGGGELYTIFWINEHYDENDPDTFQEEV